MQRASLRRRFVVPTLIALSLASCISSPAFASPRNSHATFKVDSGSMEPTLKVGERIVVNETTYAHHGINRGDVVVFKTPPNENCGGSPASDIVKRVIALPHETISLKKGSVYVNGKRLKESWLPTYVTTFPGPAGTPYNLAHSYTVPADHYFVMGDNRVESCDSRYYGAIPKLLVVGKVASP